MIAWTWIFELFSIYFPVKALRKGRGPVGLHRFEVNTGISCVCTYDVLRVKNEDDISPLI